MVDTPANFLSFLAFIWLPVSIYLTASSPFHLIGYSCDIEFSVSWKVCENCDLVKFSLFPERTSNSHLSSKKAKVCARKSMLCLCPTSWMCCILHFSCETLPMFLCTSSGAPYTDWRLCGLPEKIHVWHLPGLLFLALPPNFYFWKFKIKSKRCSLKLMWWAFWKWNAEWKYNLLLCKLLILEVNLHGSLLLEFLLHLADDGWSRR